MDERVRRLIAPGLVLLVLAGLAIAAPEIYSGTFSDLGTFLRVAAFAVALAAWAFAMRRWVRPPALGLALAIIPILAFTWIYVWPYVRPPTEVDEAFPPTAADLGDPAPDQPAEAVDPTLPATTVAPTTSAPPPASSEPGAEPAAPAATPPPTPPPTSATTTTVPTEPVELRRAKFQGLTGHRGSGDAAVYRLADSSILLRFEEVDIGSGPDLDVYLVAGDDRRGIGEGVYVADLTAERGNQNYAVPAGVDLTTGTWTVLVWCETFDVEVANATLT